MSEKKRLIKGAVTGLLCGILTAVALMCVFAVVMTKGGLLPTQLIDYVLAGFLAAGAVVGGFVAAKINRGAGLIAGALTGGCMLCALTLSAALRGEADFSALLAIKAAATILGGALGGALGSLKRD